MTRAQPERNSRNFGRVKRRDQYTCGYCCDPADCVDHVIPVSYRSDNTMANLVAACTPCNITAHGRLFASFEVKREYILQARGLPKPPPPEPDLPDASLGPLVTVVDAVWGETEDEDWPLPEDPPNIFSQCTGVNAKGSRCKLLAMECTYHEQDDSRFPDE